MGVRARASEHQCSLNQSPLDIKSMDQPTTIITNKNTKTLSIQFFCSLFKIIHTINNTQFKPKFNKISNWMFSPRILNIQLRKWKWIFYEYYWCMEKKNTSGSNCAQWPDDYYSGNFFFGIVAVGIAVLIFFWNSLVTAVATFCRLHFVCNCPQIPYVNWAHSTAFVTIVNFKLD